MAGRLLSALLLLLVLGLDQGSSSVLNDPDWLGDTYSPADVTDDLVELKDRGKEQVRDSVPINVCEQIKAEFKAVAKKSMVEAKKEKLRRKAASSAGLRKFFQILQHLKRSVVDDAKVLRSLQNEACVKYAIRDICATRKVLDLLGIPPKGRLAEKICRKKVIECLEHRPLKDIKCPDKSEEDARFRTINGTCNNVRYPFFGAAHTPFRRVQPADYEDMVSSPRVAQSGDKLPNARNVSRFVHGSNADRQNPDSPRLTHLAMNWGQFMDHDITLAETQGVICETVPSIEPECFNVEVPADDDVFQRREVKFFEVIRDAPHEFKPECSPGPREHTNIITAFIDASNVYGSNEEEAEELRAPDGTMRIMKPTHGCPLGDLLPAETDPEIPCVSRDPNRPCFVAGDERVNENQGLMSVHTLFVREHNRIAEFFGKNTDWEAEQIYQEARRIVGAELQVITYNEFLPLLLSPKAIRDNNLALLQGRQYFNGYNPGVNAQVSQAFAVAAYRFGHSLVQEEFLRFTQEGFEHKCSKDSISEYSPIPVLDFGNPTYLYDKCNGGVDSIFRGLVKSPAAKVDGRFSSSVHENLFRGPGDLSDLISINIQRGRERGVPSYTTYRNTFCKITPAVNSFEDLKKGGIGQKDINSLKCQYQSVQDIDLFVGGMLEPADSEGGALGKTFQCLLTEQFKRLRVGDRFWHENAPNRKLNTDKTAFTRSQLQEIRKVTLAKVICDNSENIPSISRRVLQQSKILVDCNKLPEMDLNVFTPDFRCRRKRATGDAPDLEDENDEGSN
ncbi:peroxidase mlt-7-like [Stylophora pistillata]|uniref:Peroxidasin-like n=1 Tax=Stylophora pistillata TaxID=50429 RepID=A0A2B4RWF3_STYPI|nr:peroxidase mlt-7-like [Stylophora pistillata]PFX20658.1 Peroxidasin-like [Stylophora pistillata]